MNSYTDIYILVEYSLIFLIRNFYKFGKNLEFMLIENINKYNY